MSNKGFADRVREGVLATTIATSAMLGVSGCNESPQPARPNAAQKAPANAKGNLYDLLSQHEFIGQDGQPVNINALRASLQNHPTTLTFGFAECENYCPMINNVLESLGGLNPSLTSVVIAANPEVDGKDQTHRDAFMKRLRGDGIKHNITILYPTEGGKLSNPEVVDVAIASGAIVNAGSPLDHSAKVVLYAAGGQRLKDKSGLRPPSEFVSEWSGALGNGQIRE